MDALIHPNFEELARHYPSFGRVYADAQAQRIADGGPLTKYMTDEFGFQLARALLSRYWGLTLIEADGHLCPPIPNRYFLVDWLLTRVLPRSDQFAAPAPPKRLQGLDIGTGATAIYALLLARAGHDVIGTDVDAASLAWAQRNVDANGLTEAIQLRLVSPTERQAQNDRMSNDGDTLAGPLQRSLAVVDKPLDFCLTNPPFFDDAVEPSRTETRTGDGRARTSMTASEGSYPGGEQAFVTDMIVDALTLWADDRPLPRWLLCMCGKKTSFSALKGLLVHLLGPSRVMEAEFGPGHLTRWFLAWTLEQPLDRSSLAATTKWSFTVPLDLSPDESVAEIIRRLQEFCAESAMAVSSLESDNASHQRLQVSEATPAEYGAGEKKPLPPALQSILARMTTESRRLLVPPLGHYCLEINLIHQASGNVLVDVQPFVHSAYGKTAVDRIKVKLEGEITRTNRRWRRKLQREQKAMDES